MVVFRKKNKKTTATRDSRKEEKTRSRCGRGTSIRILFGVVLISVSLFLTGWYHNKVNISLSSINDKIDPSFLLSSSNSNIISSSQKQVVGVVEKRSNTTIMEETKHNHNLNDSDTTADFDLSLSHYECGKFKCFIPSKSNQDIGYLVNLKKRKNKQPMPAMMEGWHLAQWIDIQFGVLPNGLHKHFFIDAPFIISLNEAVTTELCNIHLTNPDIRDTIETEESKELKKARKKKERKVVSMKLEDQSVVMDVIVQKLKKIEINDLLLYKCKGPLMENFNKKKKEYINNVIKMGNGIEFYKNLKEGYHTLQTIFKLKPIISMDFHALFDTKGNMYFTDLDINEYNQKNNKQRIKICLSGIDGFLDETQKILARTQEELPYDLFDDIF
mmetsp:Transcript_40456/g.46582  ORF Transcript_40456/g.46582 Transcript_40456/m.46582 type:complete len:386 (+) Transcript_40456:122-1279(+)